MSPVSIIIFGRDVQADLFLTLKTVNNVCEILKIRIEIIIVDDGSKIPFDAPRIQTSFPQVKEVIRIGKSVGISGAILSATKKCKYENILPIPGHNMYSCDAIINVLNLRDKGRLIIGCRNNLASERPIMKRIASRILRDLYRHLTFYFVGDIHGLILFKKIDLLRFLSEDDGHSNAIKVVTPVLAEGGLLIQTLAPINKNHDDRQSRTFRHSVPSIKNVIKVAQSLIVVRKNYKHSNFFRTS